MRSIHRPLFVVLAAVLLVATPPALAGSKPKLHASVTYAPSWEAAVEEARLLNVPIVVHNHGFFCPPCWGMHASLLQNKKYIKFADKSTVEVLVLSKLADGIAADDERAAEYEAKVDGKAVKCMVEFPGLTREQALALGSSKGASYNKTGGVPYTCIVDPHTLEELHSWSGSQSSKAVMEEIEKHADALEKEHGKGLSRKDLRKYEEAEGDARAECEDGEYARALAILDKATRRADAWPEALEQRAGQARAVVLRCASKALDEIEALAASDPKEARRRLGRSKSKLRGTGLDDRIKTLGAALAEKSTS